MAKLNYDTIKENALESFRQGQSDSDFCVDNIREFMFSNAIFFGTGCDSYSYSDHEKFFKEELTDEQRARVDQTVHNALTSLGWSEY